MFAEITVPNMLLLSHLLENNFILFSAKIYLFLWKAKLEREGETEILPLPAHSSIWLQWPGLAPRSSGSLSGYGRGPHTWVHLLGLLPGYWPGAGLAVQQLSSWNADVTGCGSICYVITQAPEIISFEPKAFRLKRCPGQGI